MKTTMKTINQMLNLRLLALLCAALVIVSCNDDDDNGVDIPDEENELEVITNVNLIFTNTTNSNDVVRVSAVDPDGEGLEELAVSGAITLTANTTYTLTYEIENALDPDDVEDIAEEIEGEDDEHQIFYGFTAGAFSNPTGTGNINATGTVNYNDEDENGNPVGLSTTWTTAGASSDGEFRIRLQHQPAVNEVPLKTATSGANDGDTDFDLTFELNVVAAQTAI